MAVQGQDRFLCCSFAYLFFQDVSGWSSNFENVLLKMVCKWYLCQKKKKNETDELTMD